MFEEFITKELGGTLPLAPVGKQALLHGHCHQKSFGAHGFGDGGAQAHS